MVAVVLALKKKMVVASSCTRKNKLVEEFWIASGGTRHDMVGTTRGSSERWEREVSAAGGAGLSLVPLAITTNTHAGGARQCHLKDAPLPRQAAVKRSHCHLSAVAAIHGHR